MNSLVVKVGLFLQVRQSMHVKLSSLTLRIRLTRLTCVLGR